MYKKACDIIKSSSRCIAFTGAGISVESGIPPFRGEGGLWNKYDPATFDIQFFKNNTAESWKAIKTIFYDLFGTVKPNKAHCVLAEMEKMGFVKGIITQNIDNLHYDAGSEIVHEFHGNLKKVVCLKCNKRTKIEDIDLDKTIPLCNKCNGVLKPDVVFFGEPIPEKPGDNSFEEARKADCFILIGTTGEVAPANMIPRIAKENKAKIIEINPAKSAYTDSITDVFINDKATIAMGKLIKEIKNFK
ncbi:MAG: NAD-dependent deacylase [Desulfobacteraceae bacterium]|nr:NAD-dependent deacylase [Desulfobacteraceae bacterium]